MSQELDDSLVRILNQAGHPVGAGFLVGNRLVLTCAHVVASVLGVPDGAAQAPQGEISLDFPLVAPGQRLAARVVFWSPILPEISRETAAGAGGDIAGLELTNDPPPGANPVRLVTADDLWEHRFRACGFPTGYDGGLWASGVLRGRTSAGWVQVEDVKAPGYRIEPGFSGGPVWDEQLDGVAGMVVAAERQVEVKAGFIIPAEVLVRAWPALQEQAIPPCPYRGLFAFREQHAPFFFGREVFTERLVKAVGQRALVAVTGPSGSGKSSVVYAGLLPRLRQQGCWIIADFRPGGQPFQALAAALMPLLEPAISETDRLVEVHKLAEALRQEGLGLRDVIERVLQKQADAERILLIADQFEELYTQCSDEPLRLRFVDALLEGVQAGVGPGEPRLALVLTIRADFWGKALSYRPLADALQDSDEILGPMNRQELERAIQLPAEKLGVAFESGLVDRILDDAGDEPGKLPLLEFALALLWNLQADHKLTHAAYGQTEGVEGALASYAEQVYTGLNDQEKEQARRVFMQMVQPGERTEDIRRLVTRPELDEAGWALTRKLADRRLVVTDRDPLGVELAEVSHEALIHGWERLQDWVKADRIFLAWLNRLRAALRQWQASGRDEGALLRGRTLAEAEGWLAERRGDLSQAETEFIQASVALRKGERAARERLRNLILAGAILAAILMALLGAFGWNRSQEARRQAATAQAASTEAVKQQATAQAEAERAEQAERIAVVEAKSLEQAERIAQAQLLATQGQLAYVEQPLLGLRLALEGLALAPAEASDARASILASLQEMAKKGCLLTLGMDVERVHSSPDGSIVVVDHGNASGELRRLAGGEAVPLAGEVGWATFSPDGATFVMSYIDAPDELRRTAGGDAEPLAGNVDWAEFSPEGGTFVVDYYDATDELRRTTGGEVVRLADEVTGVYFSPDGAAFVVNYTFVPGELRRTAGGEAVPLSDQLRHVYFSPDGATFVVDYYDATDELRRTAGGEPVPLAGEIDWDVGAYFSPDGAYFAVFYRPAWLGAELRRTSDGEVVPLAGRVEWLSFSPDGATFVVDYIDAPDELRRMAGGEPVPLAGEVDWVKFSPDGALFVVRYADAPDELRKTAGGDAVPLAFGVQQVFFSPDGATFVVAYSGAPGELRRTAGGEPHRLAAEVSVAVFSPDGAYFVVVYAPGYNRVELHRTAGGAMRVLDQFNGVRFSPDGSTFLVGCTDGRYEVWGGESFLADLGLGMKDYSFDPHSDRLVVWHTDGQAYLLDLAWLRAMGGNPAALPPEELVRIICEGPLASGLLDEAALEPYLGGREPQACQY